MSSSVPKIIACTDANDLEGVKKCIASGCNIDEQRQVGEVGWKLGSRMDALRCWLPV